MNKMWLTVLAAALLFACYKQSTPIPLSAAGDTRGSTSATVTAALNNQV